MSTDAGPNVASVFATLHKKGLISPPKWVHDSSIYEVNTGSIAYGTAEDASDFDVVGVCMPPKTLVFPHLAGEIFGFGKQKQRFDNYQEHHVFDPTDLGGRGRTFDLNSYSIVRYFHLCMECNPNMIDTLFVSTECVLHQTRIGGILRENRRLFLSKLAWHRYKGYAYSQLAKMNGEKIDPKGKRAHLRELFGYDVKFAMHTIRLLDYAEQILVHHDLDLRRNKEQLKAIRRGEVSEDEVRRLAADKEAYLERVYQESTLRHSPDEEAIKAVLLSCLEEHYGNLDQAVVVPDRAHAVVERIAELIRDYDRTLNT